MYVKIKYIGILSGVLLLISNTLNPTPSLSTECTEQTCIAPNMFTPTILYNRDGYYVPRFNKTTSIQNFDDVIFCKPYGVFAYKILGGNIDTHEYLVVSDPSWDRLIVSDQLNQWITEYEYLENNMGKFNDPYGIASRGAHSYYIADYFNDRIVRIDLEGSGSNPSNYYVETVETYSIVDANPNTLNAPMDVDIRQLQSDPNNYITLMAVADTKNSRLVFYRISTIHKFGGIAKYQSDDSGEPFYTPTSLCFGRNTNGWQNSYLWVVDNGDHKLKFYCVGYSSPGDSITLNGGGVYQFPEDSYLSCVEVDNKGLIYVLERY